MPPQTFTPDHKIRIGVLLAPPPVQLLDLGPVDLFHMLSTEYLGRIEFLPQPITDLAIKSVEILYIADHEDSSVTKLHNPSSTSTTTNKDNHDQPPTTPSTLTDKPLSLAPLTANATLELTTDLTDPTLQPGNLTLLMIPGPDPSTHPSLRAKSFIQSHATSGLTDILTVCTGIYPACHSGICDSKTVTGPRGLLSELTKQFKNVKTFEDKRWSRDSLASPSKDKEAGNGKSKTRNAELWTSAGITNGHDCVAAYIRAHFDRELNGVILRMADVGERSREYDTGKAAEGVWWVSTILMAAVKGVWRRK